MSDTPPDFPIPELSEPPPEDTGSFITAREFRPVQRNVQKIVGTERERRGELRVIKWMVGVLLVLLPVALAGAGVAITWAAKTLVEVQSDVHALGAEVHARLDSQQRDIDSLQRKDDTR